MRSLSPLLGLVVCLLLVPGAALAAAPSGSCHGNETHDQDPGPRAENPPNEAGQCHGIWAEVGVCVTGNASVNCWTTPQGEPRCNATVTCPDGSTRRCGSLDNPNFYDFFASSGGVTCITYGFQDTYSDPC